MAYDPESVREAIASSLKSTTGVAQTNAWNLPNGFSPPCLFVLGNGPISYDATYGRGTDNVTFTVRGIVGSVDSIGAQKLLSQWVAGAVKTAVQSDSTLGGLVDDLRVTDYGGDQYVTIQGVEYVYGDWSVDVVISP